MGRIKSRGRGSIMLVALLAVPGLNACSSGSSPQIQMTAADQDHVFGVDGLPSMVKTSSLVIQGRVITTEPGRQVGDEESGVTFRNVTVGVDSVLGGRWKGDTLTFEETGWDVTTGEALSIDGYQPSRPGDHGFYFLLDKPELSHPQVLTEAQGRYLITASGYLDGPNDADPLVKYIESLSPEQLTAQVTSVRSAASK